ncbi:MAG TPA: MoxR family ATPase, partial [Gemmatimonadaceae bacterium]|nr:MoxR family ATPase [Gemmatimonadaceae bacterium]
RNARVREESAFVDPLIRSIESVIVGQSEMIRRILVGLLADGHLLLEGVPGLAKTLAVKTVAQAIHATFHRIQFTPDLLPADLTGTLIYDPKKGSFAPKLGPIFTQILLADEINRAPAKTQAALLEAMGERQITIDGEGRSLGDLFTVFATQNPVEYEGTYPLPEAQLDRFLLKIRVTYPSREAELGMLDNYSRGFDAERPGDVRPPPVLDEASCRELRGAVDGVKVAPEVREYIANIVRATREDPSLTLGGSPRASVALFRTARAAALLAGRDFATPDDVKQFALPVLRHRVMVAPEAEVEGRTSDDVLDALLTRVIAPK